MPDDGSPPVPTPFTDDVELTGADRRTYAAIAAAQQYKKFETVTVSFADEHSNGVTPPNPDAIEPVPRLTADK